MGSGAMQWAATAIGESDIQSEQAEPAADCREPANGAPPLSVAPPQSRDQDTSLAWAPSETVMLIERSASCR